jgi:hypothetical protein
MKNFPMLDISRLKRMLSSYQPAMFHTRMWLSTCGTRLSIVWPNKSRLYFKYATIIGLLAMMTAALLFVDLFISGLPNDTEIIIGSVCASIGSAVALVGWLYYTAMADTTLDFSGQHLQVGRRRIPFRKIDRVGVRRNLHIERFRLYIEHTPDECLASVSVNFHMGLRRYCFGVFKSTEMAVRFARELAGIMRLEDDVIVDGTRKWPGACYRRKKLLGAPFRSRIVTNEMFSTLLFSLDPPASYCTQLVLEDEGAPIFNTALVWKGDSYIEYKNQTLYFPDAIVLFDNDEHGFASQDYCFIANIDGQLDVRVVRGVFWSSWLDSLDKSEPYPDDPIFFQKIENSFRAMIHETEKRGITLQSHPCKRSIPLKNVDAWGALAQLLGWTDSDCDNLRNYLSSVSQEKIDPLSVSKLIYIYCLKHERIRPFFIYIDCRASVEDFLSKLTCVLSNRSKMIDCLPIESLKIDGPFEQDGVLERINFFLNEHRYQITKVEMGGEERLFFVYERGSSKALKNILAVCLKGLSVKDRRCCIPEHSEP